jgi:sigma-E factor negative regulatory protein RseC
MSLNRTMHTRGLVTSINKDGFANVVMDRKNACSGCGTMKASHCHSCLTGPKIQVLVLNTQNAKEGDIVSVSLSTSKILKGAAVFYLIPVVGFLIGGLSGNYLHEILPMSETLAGILAGLFGLVLGFLIVRWISERMNADFGMTPVISKIVYAKSEKNSILTYTKDTSFSCAEC